MDTIKDRIQYLAYGRARTLKQLEQKLHFPAGALERCDRSPLSPAQLEAVAKYLNTTPAALNGEPPAKWKWKWLP